jgi:hypothetical protein
VRLRSAIWICLFLLGLAGVVFPSVYLYEASKLPQLESEFDLEKHLKNSIEGERMSIRLGQFRSREGIDFLRPEFGRLPRELVALYISGLECPAFFKSAREGGGRWMWRMFGGAYFGVAPPGDGRCERFFALELAAAIGIEGTLERTVAANKIHGFLQKDQLVAYQLAAITFDRGLVGVEDVAVALFGRKLQDLPLHQLAELSLVLPPYHYFKELRTCQNGALIKRARDTILFELADDNLISKDAARTAAEEPVTCVKR